MATTAPLSVLNRYNQLFDTLGSAGLNALFPRDFEVYMMGLELTTSDGRLVDYLSFPILPKTITQTDMVRVNVKKSLNSVSVISSSSFTPKNISMSGDFGRSFKFLLTQERPALAQLFSVDAGIHNSIDTTLQNISRTVPVFDARVKTGYGLIKILQAIINKSTGLDDKGKPFRLFLHNPTFGESHLAIPQPQAITFTQSMDKNTIHSYSLNLTLIAPLEAVTDQANDSSVISRLIPSAIQRGVNTLSNRVKGVL